MKVNTLHNTFKIIELLLERGEPISIAELGRLSGIERSAAWRIVSDLCELGYLHRSSYRKVEPGAGLVFLGQAAYSEAFFPRHAQTLLDDACSRRNISCALGGILRNHVIYFYRRDLPGDAWRWPLYNSNIALTVLSVREGAEKALEILQKSVEDSELAEAEKVQEISKLSGNIHHVLNYGYSLQTTRNGNNIALPLRRGNDVYALAFYNLSSDEKRLNTLIKECSLLRNKLV